MTSPLVSIVVPTHRRPQMLQAALRSALAQTLGDFEVLVCVDGDDDTSEGVALALQDPRIRVLHDGAARGEARNTLRGIASSRSSYFAVLHDDDEWEPDLLQALVEPLQTDPDLALAFGDHWIMDADGRVLPAQSDENSARYGRDELAPGAHRPFYDLALVQQAVPVVMTTIFRRSAVTFDDLISDLPANFDYWLGWLAARSGGGAHYVPQRLSRYRRHGGQGTVTARRSWAQAEVAMMTELLQDERVQGWHPVFERRLATAHRQVAMHRHRDGQGRAWAHACRSLKASPSARGLVTLGLTLLPRSVTSRVAPSAPASGTASAGRSGRLLRRLRPRWA